MINLHVTHIPDGGFYKRTTESIRPEERKNELEDETVGKARVTVLILQESASDMAIKTIVLTPGRLRMMSTRIRPNAEWDFGMRRDVRRKWKSRRR
jgi:hypothetical protein